MENSTLVANTTQQARATEELKFFRRGKPGEYIFANMSSLMFRRKPVMEKLGYWDSVRFGADGEFKKRLKIVFGDESVIDLKRSEEHTSELQSRGHLVCRLLLEKK